MKTTLRAGLVAVFVSAIWILVMLNSGDAEREDITLVDIDALLNGDIAGLKNTTGVNKRPFKNIQPAARQSDFKADDTQAIMEKISSARVNQANRTSPSMDADKKADLLKLKNQFGSTSDTDIKYDRTGQVRGIYDSIATASFDYSDSVAVGNVIQAIAEGYRSLFGLGSNGTITEAKVTCSDDICATKLVKSFHELPAWDHEITVSSKADTIFAIKGAFYEPALPAPSAYARDNGVFRSAIATHFSVGIGSVQLGQAAELGIAKLGNIDYYAFRLLNVSVDGVPYDVFIDAHSGNVTKALTLVFESSVEASGTALDGTVVNFQANQSGSIFQMIDSRFPVGYATGVFDYNDGSPVLITSDSASAGWPASGVSSLAYSKDTVDYFKVNHSYDAVDRQGANLLIVVDEDKENATFNSSTGVMALGIGAGQIAKSGLSFAASKDVVGHEITHGVVGSTSGLVYEYQSGALNESFSDFFGATIEGDNWLIGEDLLSPSGKALRNMAAPRDAYDGGQPAHFSEYRSLPKSNDQGGVHIYSGIPNRAMYLLSAGLTAESLGTSIGHEKTANLVFKTMIGLTPNASFDEAAEFMASLANVEYPNEAAIYDTTALAWKSVGLPQEVTTESTISNTPVTAKDVTGVAYLKPYYDTSSVLPEDNWYTVNFQVFLNSKPEFVSEANVQIPTDEYSKLTRPILVNTSDSEFAMIYQRKVDDSFYLWTDPNDTEVLLDDGTNIAGIDGSNDSEQIVLSLINTNKIYIVDSTGAAIHEVSIPSTAENGAPTPVTYIDAVRFDPTGRFVVFDFFLCGTGATDCSSFEEGNWSVGILDAVSGSVEFPFPSQPARFDVGFPAFSNLTDRYITLDIVETTADSGVISVVAIYDRETGEIEPIAYTDGTTDKLGAYGYPSFSADDTSLVYSVSLDNLQAMYVTFLDNYKLGEADPNYSLLNPSASFKSYAAALPESSNIPSLTLSTASLDFGDVIQSTDKPLQLCLENKGSFSIDIYDSTMPAGFRWGGDNRTLVEGQSVCSPVIANGVARDLGSFATTFAIIHNGANSPTAVGLSGFVDIDTDEDGIGNNKDSDDDGDDVADDVDAFPLDSFEWLDTDSDGIGNNADTDDDGDGVADTDDIFPLDSSESSDYDGDGIGDNTDTDDGVWTYENNGGKISITGCSSACPSLLVIDNTVIGMPVVSIADRAFRELELASVTIPEGITSIGYAAFHDNALTDIDLAESVTSIGGFAFSQNSLTSVTIPSGVTTIEGSTFSNNALASIDIPGSVTSIGGFAFSQNSLTSVTIPSGVTSIGESAFSKNALVNVVIPNSVVSLGDYAFFENTLLESVVLPNNLTSIGYAVFSDNALTSIDIPSSVTSIGDYSFRGNKLTSISIPDSIISIGDYAFASNELLNSANFLGDRPNLNTDPFYNDPLLATVTACAGKSGWPGAPISNGTSDLNPIFDCDNDGVTDDSDAFPLDATETVDTDSDGVGNNTDEDDDGDGVSDVVDAFPLDATETVDTDSDGTGNNADTDDDGDSILDVDDAFPNDALYSIDSDSDGMPDAWETRYGLDPNDPSDATSDQDNDGVTALDEFLAGTIPSGSLDIDGNENYDALTDGLLLLRGMFGLDGSALVTGTIASDAAYTESVDIESRIDTLGDLADIDGNGEIDALTDGLLTLRYLFGLQGDTLINGVVAGDATRKTAEEIEAHLETLMPEL